MRLLDAAAYCGFGKTKFLELVEEAKTLGRNEVAFVKGTLGSVIEQYLAHDNYKNLALNTRLYYRRVLDALKRKLGAARIADMQPQHIRRVRNEIAKTSSSTADIAVMLLGLMWDFASEYCELDLGVNPARDVRGVHKKEPHEPWPAKVIADFDAAASERMRLALHLLLYTGQRIGDVVRMRWSDIEAGGLKVIQEKTGEEVIIPIHSRLAALLNKTPRIGEYVLTTQHGGRYHTAGALGQVIKLQLVRIGAGDYTAHGLRKNCGIALAESGSSVSEIQAILGHKTPNMAMHYAQKASKTKLAQTANEKRERAGAARTSRGDKPVNRRRPNRAKPH